MLKRGNKVKRIILATIFFLAFTSFLSLNAQWARIYGGSNWDNARSIQQTSDGGYIAAGYTDRFQDKGFGKWL